MVTNDIHVILSEGESYTVEFKESPDKDLPSEVCAFANASGGKVYIGIHDDGYVVGTDTSNNARSRIQDTISKIKPRLNVGIDILENVVVLTVPEGTHKPYSCPAGFYLRSGPNSQKLDRDSIIEFFQNEGRVRYDEIIRNDLPVTDRFNEKAYKRYIKTARISNVLEQKAILQNMNCAGMSGDELCFTNAGALFLRVNDEDVVFRHAGIVCTLYKGIDKAYILDTKELNGDIVSNVDDAIIFLKKHLRVSYKIEGLRRENILELPEDALREAVVNAVCHRDYFEKGARVMVEIFDDRVDIVNPGGVCKGVTRDNFGTVSITRNSIIASMFFRIDYIEQMGTGISRMRNAAREANVPEPEFEFTDFFKVTFKRNTVQSTVINDRETVNKRLAGDKQAVNKRLAGDKQAINKRLAGDKQAINKRLAGDKQAIKVSGRKYVILTHIEKHKRVTVSEISAFLGLSNSRVRAILLDMVNDGAVEKIGKNRYTYYVLKTLKHK